MEFAELLGGLIALASGALTSFVFGLLQKASAWVDGLPARAKQALILAAAFGVVQANAFFGLALPIDALGWSAAALNTLIVAAISFGAYDVLGRKRAE